MEATYQLDRALKSIYLSTMAEALNTQTNPLLVKVKQTTNDVWGKEVRRSILDGEGYLQYKSELNSLYVDVEIPEKALRNSAITGVVVDLLNQSLEDSLSTARQDIGKALYSGVGLTGVSAIFDTEKPLYGLDRTSSKILSPLIKEADELSDAVIEQMLDDLTDRGAKIDFIAVSRDVKQSYMQHHKNIDVVSVGKFKTLSYFGIPIVYDKFVPQGTAYFLDTSVFALHQLCDWRWLETETGRILRQVPSKPEVYTATLVKYADLICDYPCRQGMIKFGSQEEVNVL